MNRLLVAAVAALAASPALAASGRWGSFELGVERYRPDIDSESFPSLAPGEAPPYERTFGTSRGYLFRFGISRAIFTRWGSLEAGVRTGFFQESAKAFVESSTTERSGVNTEFRIIPTSAALTYRLDFLADRRIPLVPYGRAAFERYNWWITNGTGGTAEKGATNGWSVTGGLGIALDFLDPLLGRELDREQGINHTYLYAEVTKSSIDDFGSKSSFDLSDSKFAYGAGLMFVF